MPKRISPEDLRASVAWGLLNLDRPDLLDDEQVLTLLINDPATGFLGRGKAIAALLRDAAAQVSAGLSEVPGLEDHRELLEHVVAGGSVAAWAKAHGKRREGVSRGLWTLVSGWVAEEVQRLAVLAGTPHYNR